MTICGAMPVSSIEKVASKVQKVLHAASRTATVASNNAASLLGLNQNRLAAERSLTQVGAERPPRQPAPLHPRSRGPGPKTLLDVQPHYVNVAVCGAPHTGKSAVIKRLLDLKHATPGTHVLPRDASRPEGLYQYFLMEKGVPLFLWELPNLTPETVSSVYKRNMFAFDAVLLVTNTKLKPHDMEFLASALAEEKPVAVVLSKAGVVAAETEHSSVCRPADGRASLHIEVADTIRQLGKEATKTRVFSIGGADIWSTVTGHATTSSGLLDEHSLLAWLASIAVAEGPEQHIVDQGKPVRSSESSREHGIIPVPPSEGRTEHGTVPVLPIEGSSERGTAPAPPTEGSSKRGTVPAPPTEGSSERGTVPAPPTEGSSKSGTVPAPPTEGSSERGTVPAPPTEGSSERGTVPAPPTEGSSEHGTVPAPPTEGSSESGTVPAPPTEGSSERGTVPAPPTEGSSERGTVPVLPIEGSSERGTVPAPPTEGSSESGTVPVLPIEGSSERGTLPAPPSEGRMEHGTVPAPPTEGSSESGTVPAPPTEGSSEHGIVPALSIEGCR